MVQDQQTQNQTQYKLISYQGEPAYINESSAKADGLNVQTKTLFFADKDGTYMVHLVVRGKDIDKATLVEANKQWDNILANTAFNDAVPFARYGLFALFIVGIVGLVILYVRKNRNRKISG